MNARILRLACRLYAQMLRAYPAGFRREYSREMMLVFENRARAVVEHGGRLALVPFSFWIAGDWLKTALMERFDMEHVRKAVPLGTAAFLLLVVDWFAFHDIREAHTFRDYLTLVASVLVFVYFGMELLRKEQFRLRE